MASTAPLSIIIVRYFHVAQPQICYLLNAAQIGGSIAGLMHGVAMKYLGHNVRILEARWPLQMVAETAGLSLGPLAQKYMEIYIPDTDRNDYAMPPSTSMRIIGADGQPLTELPIWFSSVTSTWSVIFGLLHKKFVEKTECKDQVDFSFGHKVIDVREEGNKIVVQHLHLESGTSNLTAVDMVIVADGCNSAIRAKLLPQIMPRDAGYIAWRGYVSEDKTPPSFLEVYKDKMVMTQVKNGYLLAYLTPGSDGGMGMRAKRLDWIWYDRSDDTMANAEVILTDKNTCRRRSTVPRGYLQPEVWQKRLHGARELVGSDWYEVLTGTPEPFVTNITDLQSGRASFFDGKLLLVGEAFAQIRPHLGLSTNLAAMQALSLVRVMQHERTMESWEEDAVTYAKELGDGTQAFATFGLSGKHEGWGNSQ